jgi:integrase
MSLPKVPGTKIRGSTYHLNLPVPVTLQPDYDGQKIMRRSLRTADSREAERQVRAQRAEFDATLLRRRMRADRDRLIAALAPEDKAFLAEVGGPEGLLTELKSLRTQAAYTRASRPLTWGSETDPLELEAETRAARVSAARERAAIDAEVLFLNSDARSVGRLAKKIGQEPPPAPLHMEEGAFGLRDLADAFAEAKDWTIQNRQALHYTVRRWIEFHGDLPLDELKRQHLGEFARAALRLPASRIMARKPMREAIASVERDGLPTISGKTRTRLIDHMKAMLAWAQDNGHVPQDPFTDYKLDRAKAKISLQRQRRVKPFTPSQVTAIIRHVVATADRRTMDWWLPVIAAYTGARREELGRLTLNDVLEVDGQLCLRITDEEEGQKIKNRHSQRILPVPQAVLDRGFSAYVAERRSEGGKMLWRELHHDKARRATLREVKTDPRGRFTEEYGKRFTRHVRIPLGLKDRATVFHSFRHSWTDAARRAGIDSDLRRMIAGRLEGEDPVEAGYGGADLIREKAKALEKVACYIAEAPVSSEDTE